MKVGIPPLHLSRSERQKTQRGRMGSLSDAEAALTNKLVSCMALTIELTENRFAGPGA